MALIPSSSSTREWKYDVFVNFRGVDTRTNFTDHLYAALDQKGISTFRDDEKLPRGKRIRSELLKAIEESRIAVVIFSRDYASSTWCLTELAEIVACMKNTGLVVLPVFHYVDPSDVRYQKGIYAEALKKHEVPFKDIKKEDVYKWKAALTEVGSTSGWDLRNTRESKVIQEIVGMISDELNGNLNRKFLKTEQIVGIYSRVEKMLRLLWREELGHWGGVHFVGICGMGGTGKTTLAQEIYRRISGDFQASSFIANVSKETKNQGLVALQKQLLSKILMESEIGISNICEGIDVIKNRLCDKRVLIVLDDVDGDEQLRALVGKHDWFGLGSIIILTSTDRHLLQRCGVNDDDVYESELLNNDDALMLFRLVAYKKAYPIEDYVELSMGFVNYAGGNPLAIKVLGSILFDISIHEWKSALDKLKNYPDSSIFDKLQNSFDMLMKTQKELFLDIACFFEGENINCIRDILESFDYHPNYNIDVLIDVLMDKHLLNIDAWGTIRMHDLLQSMGQEIVCHESPKEPGNRSRLWRYEDVFHVLENDTGTESIQGIVLKAHVHKKGQLNVKSFSKMRNLRLLKIQDVLLPNHLAFQNLDKLKLTDLSDSQKLIETPDFSGAPNLKHLILQRCTKLYKIHASLGNLRWLIQLDLNGCKCLEILPPKISLESLKVFDLSGCSRLKKFPEIVGNMPCLLKLDLEKTAIEELPASVQNLTNLTFLSLRNRKNLSSLTDAICTMTSLKTLILSGCSKLDELPENLGNLEGLEVLDVSGTAINALPSSVVLLKNLRVISICGCEGLSFKSLKKGLNYLLFLGFLLLLVVFNILLFGRKYFCLAPKNYYSAI